MAFNAVEMIVPILGEGFPEKGQKKLMKLPKKVAKNLYIDSTKLS